MTKIGLHIANSKGAFCFYKHNSREQKEHDNIHSDFSEYNSLDLLGFDNSKKATQERFNALYDKAKIAFEKTLLENPKCRMIKKGFLSLTNLSIKNLEKKELIQNYYGNVAIHFR